MYVFLSFFELASWRNLDLCFPQGTHTRGGCEISRYHMSGSCEIAVDKLFDYVSGCVFFCIRESSTECESVFLCFCERNCEKTGRGL